MYNSVVLVYIINFWISYFKFFIKNLFFIFWLCHAACGILVSWPGIEPAPPALEAQSLNHWTMREVAPNQFLNPLFFFF